MRMAISHSHTKALLRFGLATDLVSLRRANFVRQQRHLQRSGMPSKRFQAILGHNSLEVMQLYILEVDSEINGPHSHSISWTGYNETWFPGVRA